jgi:hypothetical protein
MSDVTILKSDRAILFRQWIDGRDLTIDEVARAMDLSLRYVADIADGRLPIRDRFIGTFARVYGAQAASEAFGLTDTPVNQPA